MLLFNALFSNERIRDIEKPYAKTGFHLPHG
jgi:hypothetical protein